MPGSNEGKVEGVVEEQERIRIPPIYNRALGGKDNKQAIYYLVPPLNNNNNYILNNNNMII